MNTLVELQNDFQEYKDSYIPQLNSLFTKGCLTYKEPLMGLNELYFFMSYILDEKANPPENRNEVALFFVYKSTVTISAIAKCLESGIQIAAIGLLRNLFEIYIDLLILLEDQSQVEKRAQLFLNFSHIEQWAHYQSYQKLIERENNNKKDVKELKKYFDQLFPSDVLKNVVANHKKYSGDYNPKKPYHWAWSLFKNHDKGNKNWNPNFEFLSNYFDVYHDYLSYYGITSKAVHNSPLSHFLIKNSSNLTTTDPVYSYETGSIAGLSFQLGEKILSHFLKFAFQKKQKLFREYLQRVFLNCKWIS